MQCISVVMKFEYKFVLVPQVPEKCQKRPTLTQPSKDRTHLLPSHQPGFKFWYPIYIAYLWIGILQKILKEFFNHRAKRGGSLFQGGSGGEERSRSDPPRGAKPPSLVAKRPPVCWGVALRSSVFDIEVAPNVDGFGWNLVGMVFGPSPTAGVVKFCDPPPGGWAIWRQRWEICVFSIIKGFIRYQGV